MMKLDGVSFSFYMNATCGLKGQPHCDSVGPEIDTSPVYAPDTSLMGVARYRDRFFSHTQFYRDAAAGDLPAFTWLNCIGKWGGRAQQQQQQQQQQQPPIKIAFDHVFHSQMR